jgi:hypothetical protein
MVFKPIIAVNLLHFREDREFVIALALQQEFCHVASFLKVTV